MDSRHLKIPFSVFYHAKLSLNSLRLFGLITQFYNGQNGCFFSKDYVAKVLKISLSSVDRAIFELKKAAIVKTFVVKKRRYWIILKQD